MIARPRADQKRRYVCAKIVGRPNCGQMAILAEPTEELVLEMLVAALDSEALSRALQAKHGTDDGVIDHVRRDEEQLEALSKDFYVEQVISREEFFAARAALTSRLDMNRAKLARRSGSRVLDGVVGAGGVLRQAWAAESLERKRAIIAAVIDHIVIGPGVKGRRRFEPERVRPVWRY